MGDFNIDLLSENNNRETFFHSTYSNECYPHINKPTRIVNNSATLIDNIFSNVFDKYVGSGLLYSDISDYLPIFVITHNNISMKSHTRSTTYRKETPQNIESFKADLTNEEWTDVFNQSNTNIAYDRFNTNYKSIMIRTSRLSHPRRTQNLRKCHG